MSPLWNPRHERFAQELAKGKTLEEAHRVAGFSGNRKTGSQLRQRPDISRRVTEILSRRDRAEERATERAIERTAITRADVLEMLVEDRNLARARGQTAAAIRAAELLGKELGMFIHREEVGQPGDFSHLSSEELEQRIVDILIARGVPEKYARGIFERDREAARVTIAQPKGAGQLAPHPVISRRTQLDYNRSATRVTGQPDLAGRAR
jgi:phage terminase small subunit